MTHQDARPVLLSPTQLQSQQQNLLTIDVRGWLEYLLGHVPGAQHLDRNRILKEVPKHQEIALTCLSGYRSSMVAQWLISQGYRRVYNLQGGLLAWQSAGFPVQRGLHA